MVDVPARERLVTVVVAPRDKYSLVRSTVGRLLDMASQPFDLVVVDDVRAPRSLRRWVERQAATHGFVHVTLRHRAGANEARMAGFARARTRYVVFLDNDAWLHDGALDALVACAEETGASAVAPAYCMGVRDDDRVHHVLGDAHVSIEDGRPRVHETMGHSSGRLRDIRHELRRTPCESIEMHCALVRADDLRAVGGLDVELGGSMDCIDLALRARQRNGVWFEPAAVVTYDERPPSLRDLPLHLDRWSPSQIEHDVAQFIRTWDLDPDDPAMDRHRGTSGRRRWKSARKMRAALHRVLGRRAANAVKRTADRAVDALSTVRPPARVSRDRSGRGS